LEVDASVRAGTGAGDCIKKENQKKKKKERAPEWLKAR